MNERLGQLIKTQVRDSEGRIATVEQFIRAYRQAHPTLSVTAVDFGDQVFVGDRIFSIGLYLDKV